MGAHPENPDKIEEIANSGLKEAILRDSEWFWKISDCILKTLTKSGNLQIQDLKKQSRGILNDTGKS